jgi:DNA anti-recombination protein RmuC
MPRGKDTDTEVSIDFKSDPVSKGGRSKSQEDQLAAARQIALDRRRQKLKVKLEAKLADLRSKLGDLRNDQLERVVKHLIETEDHHRSKLNELHQTFNQTLDGIHSELNSIKKSKLHNEHSRKSISTLSDVSSLNVKR